MTNQKEVREVYIFAGVLVMQSLPFLSAVAIAALENSRLNQFLFWRHLRKRIAVMIGWRPPVRLPSRLTAKAPRDSA
jgi:hypothetical protein